MVEEADSHSIWTYRKWTNSMRTYTAPPLDHGEDQTLAITHAEKCDVLREHLFPEPPTLDNPPPINLEPKEDNMEYCQGEILFWGSWMG